MSESGSGCCPGLSGGIGVSWTPVPWGSLWKEDFWSPGIFASHCVFKLCLTHNTHVVCLNCKPGSVIPGFFHFWRLLIMCRLHSHTADTWCYSGVARGFFFNKKSGKTKTTISLKTEESHFMTKKCIWLPVQKRIMKFFTRSISSIISS